MLLLRGSSFPQEEAGFPSSTQGTRCSRVPGDGDPTAPGAAARRRRRAGPGGGRARPTRLYLGHPHRAAVQLCQPWRAREHHCPRHSAGRRYRHRAPHSSKWEEKQKKQKKNPQTNGEFSPASAFSDNSSCASAGPGRGSIPVNRPKPSAIQIACGAAAGTTGCSCGRDAVPSWLRAPSSLGMKGGRCRMFSRLFLSLSQLPEVGEAIKRKEVEKGRCWCPDPAVRGRMGQADPQRPNPR